MFGDRTILAAGGLRGAVRIIDVAQQRHLKPVCHGEKNGNEFEYSLRSFVIWVALIRSHLPVDNQD